MKDMTDRELLDAIDDAMRAVSDRFKAKREAEERAQAETTAPPPEPPPAS